MRRSPKLLALLAAGAGAAVAFFADPVNGRRRRHMARDKVRARARRTGSRSLRTFRFTRAQLYGYGQRALHNLPQAPPELDDTTLAHKVESILFRDNSVPKGRINVNAENGVVYLRGQLDEPELIRWIEARARRIAGVRGVVSLLHVPGAAVPEH
jgi:osmotically-inducible protein OsmY